MEGQPKEMSDSLVEPTVATVERKEDKEMEIQTNCACVYV